MRQCLLKWCVKCWNMHKKTRWKAVIEHRRAWHGAPQSFLMSEMTHRTRNNFSLARNTRNGSQARMGYRDWLSASRGLAVQGTIIQHIRRLIPDCRPGLGIRIHFIWIRIWIQHLGWIPIRIQGFNDQKLKKNYSWKKKFWSKTTIYLSLGLHKKGQSYRRSLQLSKEAIQHFKTWTFK